MTIAVYAGSFDPITLGNLSVIARAAPLFERLIVLVAVNPLKQPVFSVDDRLAMIRSVTADLPMGLRMLESYWRERGKLV